MNLLIDQLREPMIYGWDFTSAPTRTKPLTRAVGQLVGPVLHVVAVDRIPDYEGFAATLEYQRPAVAAFDFPFGQPRRLIDTLGWCSDWESYVAQFGRLDRTEFEDLLRSYRDGQPAGAKEHLRPTDRLAGSRSPMKVANPPVGKMFWRGAPLLLASPVSVLPCRPLASSFVAVEGYPALVARWALQSVGRDPRASYKSDTRAKQTPARRAARAAIVSAIQTPTLATIYGIALDLPPRIAADCVTDASGDVLDAVLCAVQAAWSARRADFGIPPDADPNEGWIVDPALYNFVASLPRS